MIPRRRLTLLLLGVSLVATTDARADERQTCVDANEAAQQLRDEGKYLRAQEKLRVCARGTCPVVVRNDCIAWLVEVDSMMVSIVLSAVDARGSDLADVRVFVDGVLSVSHLDGQPLRLDPGQHRFRFEAVGFAPVEESRILNTGEKNRILRVRFDAPSAGSDVPARSDGSATPMTPIGAYVFAGTAVVALGAFAYFGLKGKGEADTLNADPCATTRTCPASDVSAARTNLIAADVGLGIAIVSVGVALWLVLSNRGSAAASTMTRTVPRGPVWTTF